MFVQLASTGRQNLITVFKGIARLSVTLLLPPLLSACASGAATRQAAEHSTPPHLDGAFIEEAAAEAATAFLDDAFPGDEEAALKAPPAEIPRSGASYKFKGRRYYILAGWEGFKEEGMAAWYGPGFQGRKTASGERFDMNKHTAAHKTLPLGTMVEVKNPANGRVLLVRINDRGPFHDDYIIDLSKAAARELGIKSCAPVSLRAVGKK